MKAIEQLQGLISQASSVVFFGGAGVSTESGIPDFRSSQGLFHQNHVVPPETLLSHSFFMKHPEVFYRFYRDHLLLDGILPNAAHLGLCRLEQMGRLDCVITQNIDGLHQAAGSKQVFELHGSTSRYTCLACQKKHTLMEILNMDLVPRCQCGGIIRPDVVLYEESLDPAVMNAAIGHIQSCDLLLISGTSLNVYPAALASCACAQGN